MCVGEGGGSGHIACGFQGGGQCIYIFFGGGGQAKFG